MSYATEAELRLQVERTGTQGAGASSNLQLLLDAASETIDGFCNRPDGFVADSVASARVYAGTGGTVQLIDECVEITQVAVKDGITSATYRVWAATDWIPFTGDPKDPNFNRLPYTGIMVNPGGSRLLFISGRLDAWPGFQPILERATLRGAPTVQVTAKWGYSVAAPKRVQEACLAQAARWYKRGESSWADTLGSQDMGTLMFKKALDPDIEMMLVNGRLVRPAIGRR